MAWYNPMSWQLWSDWGGTAWAEDLDAASAQAVEWAEQSADGRGWSVAIEATALGFIQTAAATADDVQDFWDILSGSWPENSTVDGWDDLGEAWAAAVDTTETATASREAGSVGAVVGGAASDTAGDVFDIATFAKDYGAWIAGIVVVIFVVVFAIAKAK